MGVSPHACLRLHRLHGVPPPSSASRASALLSSCNDVGPRICSPIPGDTIDMDEDDSIAPMLGALDFDANNIPEPLNHAELVAYKKSLCQDEAGKCALIADEVKRNAAAVMEAYAEAHSAGAAALELASTLPAWSVDVVAVDAAVAEAATCVGTADKAAAQAVMQAHFAQRHAVYNVYGGLIRVLQAKVATIQAHDSVAECVERAVKARDRVMVALKVAQDLAAATAKAPHERSTAVVAVVKVGEGRAVAIVTAAEDRAAAIVRAAEDRASAIMRAAEHDASLALLTVAPAASPSSASKRFHPPTRFSGASTCFPGVSFAASPTTSQAASASTSPTATCIPLLISSCKRVDPPTGVTQPPDPKRRAPSASSSSKSHILNDE